MTKDISVKGRMYEVTVSFRRLIDDGETSVSVDDEAEKLVCAQISDLAQELEGMLEWLRYHNRNFVDEQKDYIERAHTFISDINHFGVFHNV